VFTGERARRGFRAVGSQQPFYLAYHNQDHVQLLSAYGDLCARLMEQCRTERPSRPVINPSDSRFRLAIVSGYCFDHSVWTAISRGFVEMIDRQKFAVHLFYTGLADDHETAAAKNRAKSFVTGPKALHQWVAAMEAVGPDAMLYPELGMDTLSAKLAAMRLSP